MKTKIITALVLIFFSLPASLPLFKEGFFTIHDDQQFARLFLFDKALKEGQFPVRWVEDLGFGYGYPLFNFYPPFVYVLGEFFYLLGFGLISSIKIVIFISILGSAVAMYIFANEIWGKTAAFISSLFYIFAPYRAVDIYVRGALAESFSFVWLPLILWSFYRLVKTNKNKYLYLTAGFLSLLMITHNLIFLPMMLILSLFFALLIPLSASKKQFFVKTLTAIFITFLLTAFFWIPALFEKKYTLVDDLLLVNLANYKIHFVYPSQLWNWTWGYGGSTQGIMDGISFKIGKIHIISSILALFFAVLHFLFKNRTRNIKKPYLTYIFFLLFIFSAYMTTNYSQFIWDTLSPLGYLQFPWRFLTFTVLFSSILAGSLIYLLKVEILRFSVALSLILLLLIPNIKLFNPQNYRAIDDRAVSSKEMINWETSLSSFEYIPKEVRTLKTSLGTNTVTIKKDDIPKEKIEIIKGNANVSNLKSTSTAISFFSKSQTPVEVKANVFNFPGWEVKVDNQKINQTDNNPLKLINFSIPQGTHQITLDFKNTPIRTLANSITLLSIMLFLVLPFFKKWPAPKQH